MTARLPREDGAWWMALMCWVTGWAAALRLTWEPLAIAIAVLSLFFAAQAIRSIRRKWRHEPESMSRLFRLALAGLIPPAFAGFLAIVRWGADPVLIPILILGAAYGIVIVIGQERAPAARVLAVAALTGLAPATYASATGSFGQPALILWLAIGGYFLLASILVMARFRNSAPALWVARTLPLGIAGGALFCSATGVGHWILAGAFLLLGARAWAVRRNADRPDPRRVGNVELAFATLSSALILVGMWLTPLP